MPLVNRRVDSELEREAGIIFPRNSIFLLFRGAILPSEQLLCGRWWLGFTVHLRHAPLRMYLEALSKVQRTGLSRNMQLSPGRGCTWVIIIHPFNVSRDRRRAPRLPELYFRELTPASLSRSSAAPEPFRARLRQTGPVLRCLLTLIPYINTGARPHKATAHPTGQARAEMIANPLTFTIIVRPGYSRPHRRIVYSIYDRSSPNAPRDAYEPSGRWPGIPRGAATLALSRLDLAFRFGSRH